MKPKRRRQAEGRARKPVSGGAPLTEPPDAQAQDGGWATEPDDPGLETAREPAVGPAESFELDRSTGRGNEERPAPEPFEP